MQAARAPPRSTANSSAWSTWKTEIEHSRCQPRWPRSLDGPGTIEGFGEIVGAHSSERSR